MSLNSSDLDKLLSLAHITVKESQKPALLSQLQTIVDQVAELGEVEDVDPFTAVFDSETPLRDDVVRQPFPLTPSDWAPEWSDPYFVVPKLLAKE